MRRVTYSAGYACLILTVDQTLKRLSESKELLCHMWGKGRIDQLKKKKKRIDQLLRFLL